MADQKPMTVADVRAMLSGRPAESKPAEPLQYTTDTNEPKQDAKPAAKSLKTNEKGG